MMTAELYSGQDRSLVARVEIPAFDSGFPPVIVWGVRTFIRIAGPDECGYIEVFAFVATVEIIDKDDPRREPLPGVPGGVRLNGARREP